MTLALMILDYVDRQVIVSLFPYMKPEWATVRQAARRAGLGCPR
jgi:hypothetical protein